jgi:Helix-turn-helix domain
MYTVKDLQRRYSVSVHTVLGWIRSGELHAINVGRAPEARKPRWRISQSALDAFEQVRTPTAFRPRVGRKKLPGDVVEFYS